MLMTMQDIDAGHYANTKERKKEANKGNVPTVDDGAGLNPQQVDTLWRCLAQNPLSCDDLLQWCLLQAKSKEHHALGMDAFRHIFLYKVSGHSKGRLQTHLSVQGELCRLRGQSCGCLQTYLSVQGDCCRLCDQSCGHLQTHLSVQKEWSQLWMPSDISFTR